MGTRTVFLSSHLLSDLERIIDRLAILHHGRVHLSGALDDLKTEVRQIHLPKFVSRESLESNFEVLQYEAFEQQTTTIVRDFDDARFRVLCGQHGWGDTAQVHGFNLEDLFVKIVGEG